MCPKEQLLQIMLDRHSGGMEFTFIINFFIYNLVKISFYLQSRVFTNVVLFIITIFCEFAFF